jgi:hypothetical protein
LIVGNQALSEAFLLVVLFIFNDLLDDSNCLLLLDAILRVFAVVKGLLTPQGNLFLVHS